MAGEHARLSASGSVKWLNCPNSPNLETLFPDKSSSYAQEGTTAHTLGELKIKHALKIINKREFLKQSSLLGSDAEMENFTNDYRDYVIERYNHYSKGGYTYVKIEQRLDLSRWVPASFGTGDIIIISGDCLEIIDLKYGKGVQVYAEGNPQLRLYALGAFDLFKEIFDIKHVNTTVYQPRLNHISTETIDIDKLLEFGEHVKSRAELTNTENPPCIAGVYCNKGFCKARPRCKEYANYHLKLAEYENIHPSLLNDDELEDIIHRADSLSQWSTIVKSYALDLALQGKKFSSLKVVEGRSLRKFIDNTEVVIQKLKDVGLEEKDFYVSNLKTPPAIEKILGKTLFETEFKNLYLKPPGKATLVGLDDKREPINIYNKSDFEEILKENNYENNN